MPSQKTKFGGDWNDNFYEIALQRRENSFDGVSPRRVGLGGAVKDTVIVGPRVGVVTVVLGARLGKGGKGVVDERTGG